MKCKSFCVAMLLTGMLGLGSVSAVQAQTSRPLPRLNFRQALDLAHTLLRDHAAGRPLNLGKRAAAAPTVIAPEAVAQSVSGNLGPFRSGLVGTWYVTIPGPDGFQAYQTFHDDGTFTETSSLLGKLPEGPAHGTWFAGFGGGILTFELFGFDEQGESYGRIRVRNRITLTSPNDFLSHTVVDILPDGEEPILAVAEADITATRQQLLSP